MSSIVRRSLLAAVVTCSAIAAGGVYAADDIRSGTKKDLMDAMHGEAFAALKYQAYADQARKNGNEELAQQFEKTAAVEAKEHFAEHAKMAGLVGTDAENLKDAIKGENTETTAMYPDMAKRADAAGDKAAAKHFREVAKDEATHRDEYQERLKELNGK